MLSPHNFLTNYLRPFARARGRKGLFRIGREVIACYRAYGIVPRQYFLLGLYMDYIEDDAREYLPKRIGINYFNTVNDPTRRQETKDKLLCARVLQKAGVACVDEFFAFRAGQGFVARDGTVLSTDAARQLIVDAGGERS